MQEDIHLKPFYLVSCLRHLKTSVQWEICKNICQWRWSQLNLCQSPGALCTQAAAFGAKGVTEFLPLCVSVWEVPHQSRCVCGLGSHQTSCADGCSLSYLQAALHSMWTKLFFFISHQTIPVQCWLSSKKTMVMAKFLFFCPHSFTRWKKNNLSLGSWSYNSPVGIVLAWPLCGSWYTLQPERSLVQCGIPYLLTLCGPAFTHSRRPLRDLSSQLWGQFCTSVPKDCGCDTKPLMLALYWDPGVLKSRLCYTPVLISCRIWVLHGWCIYAHNTFKSCVIVKSVCASVCEMKIIIHFWAHYMLFGGLNFPLHGLTSVLRSSELCLSLMPWVGSVTLFQVTSMVTHIACGIERRIQNLSLPSQKNTLILEPFSLARYTDTNVSICGTQFVLQQGEKHPSTYKLHTFNGEQHRRSHF